MGEGRQVSRRQILALAAAAAVGAAVTRESAQGAVAPSGCKSTSSPPCVGEPGYPERVATLLQSNGPAESHSTE